MRCKTKRFAYSFYKKQNICALPLCTVYRHVALRTGPAAGLNCTYAAKSAIAMKERNIYIKKENLGKPKRYSTRSQCFLYYESTDEGKIINVFQNVQRQSDVSQL